MGWGRGAFRSHQSSGAMDTGGHVHCLVLSEHSSCPATATPQGTGQEFCCLGTFVIPVINQTSNSRRALEALEALLALLARAWVSLGH